VGVSIFCVANLNPFILSGGAFDEQLVNGKWESIALAPCLDSKFPDDYFLFVFSDNDFITENGVSVGIPYNAGDNVNNQAMVYRVTLPTVQRGSVSEFIGI
jgi:hypothetical protein